MKLAEALQERADLNIRIQQLRSRLENNAFVQEGEQPAENPDDLLRELNESVKRLEWLICRINLTNCSSTAEGQTLTELIAKKDALSLNLSVYRELINTASGTAYRARHCEIKILPTVSVRELQKKTDEMAKQLRYLENLLQQTNWTIELIEK
jgi:hypothetical protein